MKSHDKSLAYKIVDDATDHISFLSDTLIQIQKLFFKHFMHGAPR